MECRKIRDESDATACLQAAERSGLPRVAWARANGVNARSLNAWRVTLDRRRRGNERSAPRLVELVAGRSCSPVRLRVDRVEVVVEDGFDEALLARVLGVVLGC